VSNEPRTYRFGPLERRGIVGELRAAQVVILATTVALMLAALNLAGSAGVPLALVLLLVGGVAAWYPVGGRSVGEWAPVVARFAVARTGGAARYRSPLPARGHLSGARAGMPEPESLPAELAGVRVLVVPLAPGQVGVAHDPAAGTYTAALAVRVTAFGLLDRRDQERRLAEYGVLLASLARERNPVKRVQWVERTVPSDAGELGRYLRDERRLPLGSGPVSSYIELVDRAPAATQDHELVVAVQIDARKAGRDVKRFGGGDAGACRVLTRELSHVAERLARGGVEVLGALPPALYARVLRTGFDPFAHPHQRGAAEAAPTPADGDDDSDGVQESEAGRSAWPVAREEGWGVCHVDGAVARTYWIAGWPRTDVSASLLVPLLMHTTVPRAVALVLEPVAPSAAMRRVEAARTDDAAEAVRRQRQGFITSARRRLQEQATAQREAELAAGHAELRFAGFVTVHAADHDALDTGCAEVEHAARSCGLDLQVMYGEQATGLTFTLPLGRGLR